MQRLRLYTHQKGGGRMKKEDYIAKQVILEGYGRIPEMELDKQFFDALEDQNCEIAEVLEIASSTGGFGGVFGLGTVKGCVVLFKDGTIACVESDGEYIDFFTAM
jgi:hypothetical protein